MSDFSTFFPSGGGGGSLVSYDPKTLNKINVLNDNLVFKYTKGAILSATHSYFWQALEGTQSTGQLGGYITMTANSDAFQTIIDITNTGKGGKLISVIGPSIESSFVNTLVSFKITIDGTATEIEYTNLHSSSNGMRGALGGLLAGYPQTSTTYAGMSSSPFDGGYYHEKSATGNGSNSDGFICTAEPNYWSQPTVMDGINQIHFKDTCKVEIKANIPTQSTLLNNAGVILVAN